MMTVESLLSKRPVMIITVTLFSSQSQQTFSSLVSLNKSYANHLFYLMQKTLMVAKCLTNGRVSLVNQINSPDFRSSKKINH